MNGWMDNNDEGQQILRIEKGFLKKTIV